MCFLYYEYIYFYVPFPWVCFISHTQNVKKEHEICPGQESKGGEERCVGSHPSVDTYTAWRHLGQGGERCGQSVGDSGLQVGRG